MSNEIRVLLSALDPHRRDLCAAVLALCAPEFEAPAPPTQVFLSSLYQKLCGRMFPDGLPEIPALTADETLRRELKVPVGLVNASWGGGKACVFALDALEGISADAP